MAKNLGECVPILELLTQATRVATEQQLDTFAALYATFQGPCAGAVSRLLVSGYLTCHDITIRTPAIDVPLFSWQFDDPAPDCTALAAQLSRRLAETPWRRVRLFWATRRAICLVGGVSGLNRQPLQVQHDVCTTEVLLRFLERGLQQSGHVWVGEDALRRHFPHLFKRKRPDAAILQKPDQPVRILETGGIYSADDLRHIHRSYARERVPYDLW